MRVAHGEEELRSGEERLRRGEECPLGMVKNAPAVRGTEEGMPLRP